MGKRSRKFQHAVIAAQSGRVPWNEKALLECIRHVETAYRQAEAQGELEDFCTDRELVFYIMRTYGIDGMAHLRRADAALEFLHRHREKLAAGGWLVADSKDMHTARELWRALAKMEIGKRGFSYQKVKAYLKRASGPN